MFKKTEIIRSRVTPQERLALEIMAEREGVLPSEMLRMSIRSAAKTAGCWPPEVDLKPTTQAARG